MSPPWELIIQILDRSELHKIEDENTLLMMKVQVSLNLRNAGFQLTKQIQGVVNTQQNFHQPIG